jgi:hypothetical protein
MMAQIIGKTRLAFAPLINHWWNVTLYATPRGLTTSLIPYGDQGFSVDFDLVAHALQISHSNGERRVIPLRPRPLAEFYADYLEKMKELGIELHLLGRPVEVVTAIPFAQDTQHASYDRAWVEHFWRAALQVDRILKEFRGGFIGKSSPVHFFWGGFDFALTRFSGRVAPPHPGGIPNVADWVMQEAYSHEVSSAGFWPGNDFFPEAAFYAYAYPEPPGYNQIKPQPAAAYYHPDLREFILPYDAVRASASPERDVAAFLQSTYEAAANLAKWDRANLERAKEA